MKLKKIYFALLIAIMLSFAAMPAYAWITIGNSSMLIGDYQTADGSIKYIKSEKKVILNNVSYSGAAALLYANAGEVEEIHIIGENTVETSAFSAISLDGADVVFTGSGSLTIEDCSVPIIGTSLSGNDNKMTVDGNILIRLASDDEVALLMGELELKNGAKLFAKSHDSSYAVWAQEGISVSGGSELRIESDNHFTRKPLIGALTVSDTSRAEILSNMDFLAGNEVYDADSVTIEATRSMQRPDYFAVSDYVAAAGKNRISIDQTIADDGRYRIVIQGDNYSEIPETGDSANLTLYAAMVLLGAGALIRMKKREA